MRGKLTPTHKLNTKNPPTTSPSSSPHSTTTTTTTTANTTIPLGYSLHSLSRYTIHTIHDNAPSSVLYNNPILVGQRREREKKRKRGQNQRRKREGETEIEIGRGEKGGQLTSVEELPDPILFAFRPIELPEPVVETPKGPRIERRKIKINPICFYNPSFQLFVKKEKHLQGIPVFQNEISPTPVVHVFVSFAFFFFVDIPLSRMYPLKTEQLATKYHMDGVR